MIEFYIMLAMIGAFAFLVFLGKLPIGVSLVISAIIGGLIAGYGFPLRHLVEGSIAYLDPLIIVVTAIIFMELIKATGALDELSKIIIKYLHPYPFWMLSCITIFIMFPGMVTGLSTVAVLTTGAIVAPALMAMGIPKVKVGTIIALSGILGMVAPPINVPIMIIGGGIDMPYIGFGLPLLFASFPLAILITNLIGHSYVKDISCEKVMKSFKKSDTNLNKFYLFLPIIALILLMLVVRIFPNKYTSIGLPLMFIISSIISLRSGKSFKIYNVLKDAMVKAMPVMGILVGIGVFIQIMALTGVRGYIVLSVAKLPSFWLYVGIAISLPLFGAVSSYGAAYVLGVPFLLALLTQNEMIVAVGIALIASLGDMMPPTALAGIFAAQVVEEKNYFRILKVSLPYLFLIIIFGILVIIFSDILAKYLII